MSFEIKDKRDLNVLKGELKNFIEENPNSTEEEQDAHLTNFINNAGLERPKARSIGKVARDCRCKKMGNDT